MSDKFEFNNIPFSDLPGDWSTPLKLSWIEQGDAVVSASINAESAINDVEKEKARNDSQDKKIEDVREEIKDFNSSIFSVQQSLSKTQRSLSSHTDANSAHGSNGAIVGTNDYASVASGGVVFLARSVNVAPRTTLPQAPDAYDQAEEQLFRNGVGNQLNKIVDKINEIINGQKTALQMASSGGGGGGKPEVITSPESSFEAIGMAKSWSAEFSGSSLTYQWFVNDAPVDGATDETYNAGLLNSSWNGNKIYCQAKNDLGTATTSVATVTMRRRIYINTSIWRAFNSTSTATIKFKANGYVDIETSEGVISNLDTWVEGVNDASLGTFNISEYQVMVKTLPSYFAKVGGDIKEEVFTDMTDGISLTIDVTGLSLNQSGYLTIHLRDKVMPGYSWAGWDNGDVFFRHI